MEQLIKNDDKELKKIPFIPVLSWTIKNILQNFSKEGLLSLTINKLKESLKADVLGEIKKKTTDTITGTF